MSDESHHALQREIRTILLTLSKEEQKLLSEVIRIERENLHIKEPRLKDALLQKVKEVIK